MLLFRILGCCVLAFAAGCAQSEPRAPAIGDERAAADHVLILSVDGLRPDALLERAALPALARLLDGAATLDARCDPDWSLTLPNHVGMLTGRFVEGPDGHGWRLNDMPPPGLLLRPGQPSALHAARAAGVATGMFVGKEKFVLFPRAWDGTIGRYALSASARASAERMLAFWEEGDARSLALLHFAEPDAAGHDYGWDLTPGSCYLEAVAASDAALGLLLAWLDERPARCARTAIVLTADHGGGVPFKHHNDAGRPLVNVRVPFLIWHGGGYARGDLYALNRGARRAPGDGDPRRGAAAPPPIRNLDAAAAALSLLGLPPLPGEGGSGAPPLLWSAMAAR